MKRTLIAGIAGLAACAAGAVHARGVDLQGDVLAALLTTDTETLATQQNSRRGDEPAPATYADRALRLGGGGGAHHVVTPPDFGAPGSDSTSTPDQQVEPRTTAPGPHASAWRALLPGSIQ